MNFLKRLWYKLSRQEKRDREDVTNNKVFYKLLNRAVDLYPEDKEVSVFYNNSNAYKYLVIFDNLDII
jgi:hypothetical protein